MIACCDCGIILLLVGQVPANGCFITCSNCESDLYAFPELRKSFPASDVFIDHEKQEINIKAPT